MSETRHYFPGNNTPEGFFSYYRYILTQREANKIICIKGGPGTGKSTFMKAVGSRLEKKGLNIDLEKYVQVQYKEQIEKVINELGVEKLKPLKEALPEEITYFDIRYYVVLSKLNKR